MTFILMRAKIWSAMSNGRCKISIKILESTKEYRRKEASKKQNGTSKSE